MLPIIHEYRRRYGQGYGEDEAKNLLPDLMATLVHGHKDLSDETMMAVAIVSSSLLNVISLPQFNS